jgi:hypothetical protein
VAGWMELQFLILPLQYGGTGTGCGVIVIWTKG